jgi:UDP-N-acetylglucosamine:LPS N-acetylglucosamine transferase
LADNGHRATIKDFLEAAPLGAGRALSRGYEAELRHAPWAYELAFRVWYWFPFLLRPLSRLLSLFTRRAIRRWVKETGADLVVSTYPVATQVLGDMRRRAKKRRPWPWHAGLSVPAVNFITDFGYHPFWAHRGIDLNLAVHPTTVAAVARRTRKPSMACAPLVNPQFAAAAHRRALQRADIGLAPEDLGVLISSGSWGVGTVRETLELVANEPGLVPVVACGRNDGLRLELERLVDSAGYRAVVLGWTDDMPGVMAACDVLVENAGGLTSLEAMRARLPMVSFRPIPGHGRKSAAAMSAAGVSCLAAGRNQLVSILGQLGRPGPAREAQLTAAARLFGDDAAAAVAQIGTWGVPPPPRLRPLARLARAASATTLLGAISWVGLTTGVGVAAAAGAGVAHPPPGQPDTVYVGVRVDDQELADRDVRETLLELDASAVVNVNTADVEPSEVRAFASVGIDVESGGLGYPPGAAGAPLAPWTVAHSDSRSVQVLSAIAGEPVEALVPDRSLSAFDLVDASVDHVMMVVPNATLPVAPGGPFPRQDLALPELQADQIYVVNGQAISCDQLIDLLSSLRTQVTSEDLVIAPLDGLR